MNRNQKKTSLNPLTPSALAHITALARQDDEGLAQRCARYRRRVDICRVVLAICIFVVAGIKTDAIFAQTSEYTEKTVSKNMSTAQAVNDVYYMLRGE